MKNVVYLLLGSNLGDRGHNLSEARNAIQLIYPIQAASAIYRTEAWGNKQQPDFLNQVVQLNFEQSPKELLSEIQAIEKKLGRMRTEKWGPRLIDIDILFIGNLILNEIDLIIPHAQLQLRRFTLLPLVEIAPDFIHPLLNKSCLQLLHECSDPSVVEFFKP